MSHWTDEINFSESFLKTEREPLKGFRFKEGFGSHSRGAYSEAMMALFKAVFCFRRNVYALKTDEEPGIHVPYVHELLFFCCEN